MACIMVLVAGGASAQPLPLTTEITAEHPAYLFSIPARTDEAPDQYAARVAEAWNLCPPEVRPYALLVLSPASMQGADAASFIQATLEALELLGAPLMLATATQPGGARYDPAQVEQWAGRFHALRGILLQGLALNYYAAPGASPMPPPDGVYATDMVERLSRYGRLVVCLLSPLDLLRVLTNPACRSLVTRLQTLAGYWVPIVSMRGRHVVLDSAGALGAWFAGVTERIGVAPDLRAFSDAHYSAPGTWGDTLAVGMPPAVWYRPMTLIGASIGASVYYFSEPRHAWFGEESSVWEDTLAPLLEDMVTKGLIAPRDWVEKRCPARYQASEAPTPLEFHRILTDWDPFYDHGYAARVAYGMDLPGQFSFLFPHRNGYYFIPILSPLVSRPSQGEEIVFTVNQGHSAEEWQTLLQPYARVECECEPYVVRVGRAVFVFNTSSNLGHVQTFRIDSIPAPVRNIVARRDGNQITLSWGFREGDISYSVFRRFVPSTRWARVARGITERQFVDTLGAEENVAYTVTALTSEHETFTGSVPGFDAIALSAVESPILEQVVLTPLLSYAESQPISPEAGAGEPAERKDQATFWGSLESVPEEQRAPVLSILERMQQWMKAMESENLEGLMEIYQTDYTDASGWNFSYARRAWQWLFERYHAPRVTLQFRGVVTTADSAGGEIRTRWFIRVHAVAVSDSSGSWADIPILLPKTSSGEITLDWGREEGSWRIVHSEPAFPNFADLLSYSLGPYDPPLGELDHFPNASP